MGSKGRIGRNSRLKVCALIAASIAPASAYADLTVQSVRRYLFIDGVLGGYQENNTTGPYQKTVLNTGGSGSTAWIGQVTMDTYIDPLKFGGSGSSTIHQEAGLAGNVHGHSTMEVNFITTTPYPIKIFGTLANSTNGVTVETSTVLRFQSGTVVYAGFSNPVYAGFIDTDTIQGRAGTLAMNYTGVLAPGAYQFQIHTDAWGQDLTLSNGSASYSNVVLELPEPASLGFLAAGAAGLLLRRRSFRLR